MDDPRYWIINNPDDPENLDSYVAIVDEHEGGILAYVLAPRAENLVGLLLDSDKEGLL